MSDNNLFESMHHETVAVCNALRLAAADETSRDRYFRRNERGFSSSSIDDGRPIDYSAKHIRPLAVSPLHYPESEPTPWGFSISGSQGLPLVTMPESLT
ncbi:MAG: hypothetical protein Q8S20_08680 [Sulfuritalea sp.]|nr:hypothetical protein [Sulfuritalea sp.]